MVFFCDAMLGGLARWLRAAGYDSAFEHGIDDADLVHRARETGRTILSSDGGLFERAVVRDGVVPALFVPRGRPKLEQLAFVLRAFGLAIRDPRCMDCGGELAPLRKEHVALAAPPIAFERCMRFYLCRRCDKLLWEGTHWKDITRRLATIALA